MRQMKEVLHGLKPVSIMVFIQFTIAGLNVFYKLAAKDGMNLRILVAYCWIFGAAFMIPLALIFERPQLTWTVICQSFFCGLSGPNLTSGSKQDPAFATSEVSFSHKISQSHVFHMPSNLKKTLLPSYDLLNLFTFYFQIKHSLRLIFFQNKLQKFSKHSNNL
ncbi:WAT1-related protein At1g25270-like isoform X2 [Jatropha curcas]|uniref:WAT1-related protein At1g25270-like isoform X2 n=1 Tax=Jatropha curcas TaxID=180498 RepID=UPI0018952588|nr:WAT1-related protein At1g25270-like isoform X2 [Jatropha curcas]